MESIKIDSDVFEHLQQHARPFVDTPNSTLRRLLGIDSTAATPSEKSPSQVIDVKWDELLAKSEKFSNTRSKAPKANLEVLVQMGLLKNGQKLYLVDYQRNPVQKLSAVILGGDLIYNDLRYSMSNLAQELLAKVGFKSNSVRGPAHWVTDEGKSIKDLWLQQLEKNAKG